MQELHTASTIADLRAENAVLRARLEEAEHALCLQIQEQHVQTLASASTEARIQLAALLPEARAVVHELAQPLNTAACYAVAARNLAARSSADNASLRTALHGIDQQIQRAGEVMERLRHLLGHTSTNQPARPDAPRSEDTG